MIRRISCILLGLLLLTSMVSAQQDSTPTPTPQTYMVVPGDTLSSVAVRYHTTVQELVRANGIINPNLLLSGTILTIPPGGSLMAVETVNAPAPTVGPSPTPSSTPIPTPTRAVGMEVGGEVFSFDHVDLMVQAGMSWTEVKLNWKIGDTIDSVKQAIDFMRSINLKILLSISGDAQQYHADPKGFTQQYVAFLGQVAALNPTAIEVWSGINADGVSAGDYAQILNAAFLAIKQANLQVLVISGAQEKASTLGAQCTSFGCGDLPYLQALADAGIADSADCIGLHYTIGAIPPNVVSGDVRGSQFIYYFPTVVTTYAGVFPNKPLCFTAFGYLVPGQASLAPTFEWAQNTTNAQRAGWIARALELASQSGRIRLFIVDNIDATTSSDDDPAANYAIVDAKGACLACQTIRSVFLNAQ